MAGWLFVLCLPVLLVTASLGWAVNSFRLYNHGLEKNNISQTTGLAPVELDKVAAGLISYFNSNEPAISITVVKDGKPFELFNQREIVHLRDVKALIQLDYWVLLATLLYILGYAAASLFLRRRRELARGALTGAGLTLALMLALGVGMMLNFDRLFTQFHLISFSNDFWQLDPARDYLIRLFPEPFWNDAAWYIAIATAAMALVIGGASAGYLAVRRKRALKEGTSV